MQRWLTMSAAALGRAIAKGDIDPVDLAQTYLDAIDAHPFTSRIYTVVTRDRALVEAQAASDRARLGQRKSELDGVPPGEHRKAVGSPLMVACTAILFSGLFMIRPPQYVPALAQLPSPLIPPQHACDIHWCHVYLK